MPDILLNIDLGEWPDEPQRLYALAHIANIACGGHAGDDASMRRAMSLCRQHGTQAAAHPSYADREGFGRRELQVAPGELRAGIASQCGRLAAHAGEAGVALRWVKPHGALYHAADRDAAVAEELLRGACDALGDGIGVIGPGQGEMARVAARLGLSFAREGFADRAFRETAPGRFALLPRSQPGALVTDPVAACGQARTLAKSGFVDTICVHGDSPHAVELASAVREFLDAFNRSH